MKKLPLFLLILVSLFSFSCENNDETPEVQKIDDDYKLLSITSEGKIFEIGNNSGKTTTIGQIKNSSNLIMLSTICNVGSKIYAFEATYIPHPNILIIYDKLTGTTTTKQITLPVSLTETMLDPFITNLKYNGSELVAIVSENQPNRSQPNKIISINIQNYQTTDLGINFFLSSFTTSTELINNKLYVSTVSNGLLEIDLTDKTVKELQADGTRISATRLAKINDTKLGLMNLKVPKVINGVKPFDFNLSNNLLSDKSSENLFAVGNIIGGTIFYNEEYLNLVFRTDSKFGILKINHENNSTKFVELDKNVLGQNAIIIDVIK
ncbi:hypothetical protein [Flavobacterium sp. PS2]|uniref:hypothetical protein n=1 Tax=Flavobacterium sp. PS2 TaxID=3384157 RepID=UPI00390CB2A9